jgi:hypothetical protein
MGERAQVRIQQRSKYYKEGKCQNDPDVYLYTHWGGLTILEDVAAGLVKGEERWKDCEYLTRIIFDSLIGDRYRVDPIHGFGIGTYQHSDIDRLVTIFPIEQKVQLEILLPTYEEEEEKVDPIQVWGFREFIETHGIKNP